VRLPRPESSRLRYLFTAGLVTVALFWIAWDNGSYGLESRNALAIAIWWTVIVVIVFGLLPREKPSRASLTIGALMGALALWILASLLWTASAEKTFDEFNRLTLYFGVFVLACAIVPRTSVARWIDGLAAALSLVAGIALVSRLFPGSFQTRDLETFLPAAVTRLSFPLGYWNGLAILVALAVPPLLSIAVVGRTPAIRGIALAPVPVIASVIYLASSRGGVVCAALGGLVFLILTERRWVAGSAVAVSALGSSVAIGVLVQRAELVDGPLHTDLVEHQGRSAALLIILACAATGAVWGIGTRVLLGRAINAPPIVGWVVVLVVIVVSVIGVRSAGPVEQFRTFKKPPSELGAIDRGDFVTQHLLSSRGSGRWQFWDAAIEQWRQTPLWGDGAGSYESWWAENGSIALFVRDAHSLYLEVLGELGLVGFALVLALVGSGVGVGIVRARAASGDERVRAAALTAVFTAYAASASFDWVWELTAISVVGFVALGLISGPATAIPAPLSVIEGEAPRRRPGAFGLGVAAVLIAWVIVFAQAIPLLAQREVDKSRAASARGNVRDALDAAESARDIQPWAATPYLQLALVSEQIGALPLARMWIRRAIARDREDWRFWLIAARLETKLGRVAAAERSLDRAVELNPRSPLFKGLVGDSAGG